MNAGTKYFAPAIISNVGLETNAISYAIEQIGVELVFKVDSSLDNETNVQFYGLKNVKLQKEIVNAVSILNEHFPWKEKLRSSISLDIYNKIPKGSGLFLLGTTLAGFLVALNNYNKRPFEQRDLFDFAKSALADSLDAKTYNDIACSLIGGMVLGHDGSSINEYQRISMPQGFSSVVCLNSSKTVVNNDMIESATSLDYKINAAAQMALMLYKTNLDGFVAFTDRHFSIEKLSLFGFEQKFCKIAHDFDIKALFRPAVDGSGLVALAINSFKASELADTFNKTATDDFGKNVKAIHAKHNLEGVYRF